MLGTKKILRYFGTGLVVYGLYLYRKRKPAGNDDLRIPPRLRSSSPKQDRPTLIDFSNLNERVNYDDGELARFPNDATGRGNFRLLELAGVRGPEFFVHVYNGSLAELPLQVYGIGKDGRVESLLKQPIVITRVAQRVPVTGVKEGAYRQFYVRFSLGGQDGEPYNFAETNVISLATYNDEPVGEGGIEDAGKPLPVYEERSVKLDIVSEKMARRFSHEKNTFQSVIISSCDTDYDLQSWARQTGLDVAAAYFGPLGGVVVLGIDLGLSPNTTGGNHIRERIARDKTKTTTSDASPNYVVNQYDPKDPQHGRDCENDQPVSEERVEPYADATEKGEPLLISVIDSGVDESPANADLRQHILNQSSRQTPFVRRGRLGYDFIEHDEVPQDELAHGTYVAGVIAGYYRGEQPLQLVHFRIFGKEGISTYFGALVSIYEAATIKSRIINMSWGMYAREAPPALECALRAAIRQGCYLVTSAGNDRLDIGREPQWPAAFVGVQGFDKWLVSVASYRQNKKQLQLSDFTNYGGKLVTVAAHESARAPRFGAVGSVFPRGTSISAPLVTAAFATILANDDGAQIGTLYDHFTAGTFSGGKVRDGASLVTQADRDARESEGRLVSACEGEDD